MAANTGIGFFMSCPVQDLIDYAEIIAEYTKDQTS
jgi:hypothetical protein